MLHTVTRTSVNTRIIAAAAAAAAAGGVAPRRRVSTLQLQRPLCAPRRVQAGLLASGNPAGSLTFAAAASPSPSLFVFRRQRSCGIIGLPNVGKSTLFNALTDTQLAEASNYPFCTIEPNTASVAVPDPTLVQLAQIAKTDKVIFNQVKFVDIAGIIKGASQGAGLGNKFLQNIKDVDVLLHVVRCFEDPQVVHVESKIDPLADMEVIETELLLADLQTIEKRIENAEKAKSKGKDANSQLDKPAFYNKLRAALNAGVALLDLDLESEAERAELASMQLITSKPQAYVCNVDSSSTRSHNPYTQKVFEHVEKLNNQKPSPLPGGIKVKRVPRACLRVCSQLESEVQTFDTPESRKEFLELNDLHETSLLPIIQTSNRLLNNIAYYTVGEIEARAWGITIGTNAQQAAGKIHSDLRDKFVCAEVIKPTDFIKFNGDKGVRDAGLMKVQGKDYVVENGDIMLFRVAGQKGR